MTITADVLDATVTDRSTPTGRHTDPYNDDRMRALCAIHQTGLFRFLRRLNLGDHLTAQDLTQETLLRAWHNIDRLPTDPHTLGPWLYTVARRLSIDAARARAIRPPATTGEHLPEQSTGHDDMEHVINAETIRPAVAKLSKAHQAVIIEIYYHGHTVPEAAQVLGVPEGTVKSRIHYALHALRRGLGSSPLDSERNAGR